jgi:hypothetical protein
MIHLNPSVSPHYPDEHRAFTGLYTLGINALNRKSLGEFWHLQEGFHCKLIYRSEVCRKQNCEKAGNSSGAQSSDRTCHSKASLDFIVVQHKKAGDTSERSRARCFKVDYHANETG